jgi:hypothetical protein
MQFIIFLKILRFRMGTDFIRQFSGVSIDANVFKLRTVFSPSAPPSIELALSMVRRRGPPGARGGGGVEGTSVVSADVPP